MIREVCVIDMRNPYKTAVWKPEVWEPLENRTRSWETKNVLLYKLSVSVETGLIRCLIGSSGGLL